MFHAWVEDWEEEPACSRRSYKGLVFLFLDNNNTYSIFEENMENRWGSRNGWFAIALCLEEGVEDQPFTFELACELIGTCHKQVV